MMTMIKETDGESHVLPSRWAPFGMCNPQQGKLSEDGGEGAVNVGQGSAVEISMHIPYMQQKGQGINCPLSLF